MKASLMSLMFALLALPALADGEPARAAASTTPPDVVVKANTDKLQQLIAANHDKYQADLPTFYNVVDEVIVPHFDVPFIAKTVLGKNWRGASEEQRKRFAEAFKSMLIRNYANAMIQYSDTVKAEFKPLRMAPGDDDVTVMSNLLRNGKPPVAIGFAMHLDGGAWKIYDITVENISLVTNFRAQFNAEIKRSDLDSVIARMESGELSARKMQSAGAASGG